MGVTLKDAIGNTLTGRVVTWNSSNPAVASVDANGLVQALAAGQTQITATSEGITSHPVTLTVIP
jgi:alpha-amylase